MTIIKALLNRDSRWRLGAAKSTMFKVGGVSELKNHSFFKRIHWQRMFEKKCQPPIVPVVQGKLDTSNFHEEFTSASVADSPRTSYKEEMLAKLPHSPSKFFQGFSWQAEGAFLSVSLEDDEFSLGPSSSSSSSSSSSLLLLPLLLLPLLLPLRLPLRLPLLLPLLPQRTCPEMISRRRCR